MSRPVRGQGGVGDGDLAGVGVRSYYRADARDVGVTQQDLFDGCGVDVVLRRWVTTLTGYVRIKHDFGEALHSAAAQEIASASWPPGTAAVKQLLDACERAGEIRSGIDPVGVITLRSCLWRTPDGAAQADRLLDLAITGLR